MKTILLIAISLLVLTVSAWSASPAPSYEYKVEYGIKENKINKLANEGWELVATGSDNAAMTPVPYLIFKRPR